jgi:hypothetical protein
MERDQPRDVAQDCILPYRRFVIGGPDDSTLPLRGLRNATPGANRRYSGLKAALRTDGPNRTTHCRNVSPEEISVAEPFWQLSCHATQSTSSFAAFAQKVSHTALL